MTLSALFILGPISVYEYSFNIILGYLFAKVRPSRRAMKPHRYVKERHFASDDPCGNRIEDIVDFSGGV